MSSDNNDYKEEIEASDVDYESEEELGSVPSLQAKLKKLRAELTEANKAKAEYLDGWQRSKAEMVNVKRESQENMARAGTLARIAFIEDILPALDSFDMAMLGDGWKTVDPAWRMGVESIRQQLGSALANAGISEFGAAGDIYDPMLHEAVQEVDGGLPDTVAKVLRKGYRAGERIIRPAHVVLYRKA